MEVTPGIKAKPVATDADEVAQIRARVADQVITEKTEKERQRAAIIASVMKRIEQNDGPIRITQEMADLGIDKQIAELIQRAELELPLRQFFRDTEDDAVDFGDPKQWID